jgi:serine/threonine-protein kinase
MVWPPPKIQLTPEGEPPRELKSEAGEPDAPVTGAYGASAGALPSSLPPDWLQHPEKLVGAVLGGRYRITGLYGRGPMGVACEGESSRGRQVTLKLLPRPPEMAAERFAWQVREALAMAHFDHPNVVASTDFGALEGGGAFVSRSRVQGVTLRAILRQGGLPLRRALELARQIGLALAAGHRQDIPHGRLKPENILVQVAAREDVVKVVDFGLGQLPVEVRAVVSGEQEARRLALRTRMYMPGGHLPGVEALPSSAAVDVYALGVLLFEMVAGQPPFALDAAGWPNLQHGPIGFADCEPRVQVPRAVEEVVLGLMLPDAGVSAEQVVAVIESLLGRPSMAPPAPSPGPEPEPVTSQHPSAAALAGAVSFEPPPPAERGAPPEQRAQSYPPLPPGFPMSQPPGTLREPPQRSSAPPPGPSGSYPPLTLDQSLLSSQPGPVDAEPYASSLDSDDDMEAEFRPSLMARLRRMFGRSKPSGF